MRMFSWLLYLYLSTFQSVKYSVSLHIQSECGKIRTRKTPKMDTFYAVEIAPIYKVDLAFDNSEPISCHESLSIPLENIRKPMFFGYFQWV